TRGCVHINNNTATCDDGNACTNGDHCSAGACIGTTINCDDNNICTEDNCNTVTGCTHTSNSRPCSDGNACTLGDNCSNGNCVSGPLTDCDDNNPCTSDSCDRVNGCTHQPVADGTICVRPSGESGACFNSNCAQVVPSNGLELDFYMPTVGTVNWQPTANVT